MREGAIMKLTLAIIMLSCFVMLGASLSGCSDSNDARGVDPGGVDFSVPSRASALVEIGQLQYLMTTWGSPFTPLLAFRPVRSPVAICDTGSVEVTETEKERPLNFYTGSEAQAPSNTTTWQFQDCVNAYTKRGGYVEIGTLKREIGNMFGPFYQYAIYDDYRLEGEGRTEEISGSIERRDFDDGGGSASTLARVVERGALGLHSILWEQGTPGNPLRLDHDLQGLSWGVTGSWNWATSKCIGGSREVQGGLVFPAGETGFRDDAGFPEGGTLNLTAGAASMAITFSPDGAIVTFHDGTVIDLSIDEIRAAVEDPIC